MWQENSPRASRQFPQDFPYYKIKLPILGTRLSLRYYEEGKHNHLITILILQE